MAGWIRPSPRWTRNVWKPKQSHVRDSEVAKGCAVFASLFREGAGAAAGVAEPGCILARRRLHSRDYRWRARPRLQEPYRGARRRLFVLRHLPPDRSDD